MHLQSVSDAWLAARHVSRRLELVGFTRADAVQFVSRYFGIGAGTGAERTNLAFAAVGKRLLQEVRYGFRRIEIFLYTQSIVECFFCCRLLPIRS